MAKIWRLCMCVLLMSVATSQGITEWACEGDTFSVTCPAIGEVVVISSAFYGIGRSQTECGVNTQDVRCSASRAKLLADTRCSGKQSCEFSVQHHKIPELNCRVNDHNMMKVSYECVNKSSIIDICNTSGTDLPLAGYLSSPSYPKLYPTKTECKVTMPAQPGDTSVIVLHDLLIETRNATACLDYLMIEDTGDKPRRYCGTMFDTSSPSTIMGSLQGFQKIHFKSDSTYDPASRGFLLKYKIKHTGERLTYSTIASTDMSTLSSSILWKRASSIIRPIDGDPSGPTRGSTLPSTKLTPRSTPIADTTILTTQNDTKSTILMSPTIPAVKPNMSFPTTQPTEKPTVEFTPSRSKTNEAVPQSSTTSKSTAATATTNQTKYTTTTTPATKLLSTPTVTPILATDRHNGLSNEEMVAVIVVVIFVVIGLVLLFILICCIKSKRRRKEDKFSVSYNNGSSLLSYPSRESTSSTTPLDLAFSNNVYDYDFDSNNGGTVVVDTRNVHVIDEVDELPAGLRKKIEDEASMKVENDNEYAEISLQAGAMAMPEKGDVDPLENTEQSTQAMDVPSDIFIMDIDAQDRKQRREDAKRDEPPSDYNYDVPIAREESMRMNAMPEISLDHDVICMDEDLQNEENAQREEQCLDTVTESVEEEEDAATVSNGEQEEAQLDVSMSSQHSDNTNNNASLSDEDEDFLSLFGRMMESTDL